MKWTILESECPQRLFDFLAKKKIPKPIWKKMIQQSHLYYQNKRRHLGDYLIPGEILDLSEYFPSFQKNTAYSLEILYENDHLLIVNKPAGLLTHPASTAPLEISLNDLVMEYFYRSNHLTLPHPVTRLDRNTSGLVLYAKNSQTQAFLQKSGVLAKHYLALIPGKFPKSTLFISGPIQRKPNSIIERQIGPQGQIAVTQVDLKDFNSSYSLVECQLLTGRTHQIRVHLTSIGYPLCGDDLYGGENASFLTQGHALHAWKLSITKESDYSPLFSIHSPLPNYIIEEFPDFSL